MLQYQKILLGAFLLFLSFSGVAQYQFPDDHDGFINLAKEMMANTKKERSERAFESFANVWNGGTLNDSTKKKIIELSQIMAQKRLRPSTNFTDFFASIGYGVQKQNMPASDIDTLLYVTEKALNKFDPKELNEFFSNTARFLENYQLYASSYNQLNVSGGTFKFKFVETTPEFTQIDKYDQQLEQQDNQNSSGFDDWGNPDDHFDDWDNQEAVQDDWSSDWGDSGWGDDSGWDDNSSSSNDGWGDDSGWEDNSSSDSNDGWNTDNTSTDDAWGSSGSATTDASNIFDVGYTAPAQPKIEGAIIEFENVNLAIVTDHDSASIKETKGSFLLKNGIFVGEGGKFDWSTIGMTPEELYVELDKYNFAVRSPKLSAEPVKLHYPAKTDSIVEGVFDFQSKKRFSNDDAQYPRFKSFASNIPVKGLGDNIEYKGGLALEGKKLYSSSIDEGRAQILIKRNGKVKVKAVANRFEFSEDYINGNVASIVIYQENDSIYHPGTVLNYKNESSTLRLTKTSAYRSTPFIDTYHNMEITVDALIWNLDSPEIQLSVTNAANELPAKFESKEFFEAIKYSRLQGIYRFHPLQMIVGYAEGIKRRTKDSTFAPIYTNDLATRYGIEESTLKGAMMSLMRQGFIDYDNRIGEIKLREKALHYVYARRDKKDYDNLSFESLEPSGNNATLNLDTKDLTVKGVDIVRIMDSLNIFIEPESKTLTIKGNRGFAFDGKINTANFQFIGKQFEFDYDSFLVHMPEIEKIRLAAVDPNDNNKNKKQTRVLGNELRYSSGTLYLNKPDNKSGRENFPEYPIFNASTGASVYFDKQEIAGGVYDTTIKFKIPPFTVDSLASDDPQSIGFDGEFESNGIFPNFETKLVVMPDFSLGFNYEVPEEGFQLYEGKGKYYNKITMDNKGLTGKGRIEFLNTTCYSEQFHFFVDSVLTIGTNTETVAGTNPDLPQEVTFPGFTVGEYEMNWKPKKDSMNITNYGNPFQLYQKTATLNGTAIITEKGMLGSGVVETRGSVAASSKFHFEEKEFDGRNTVFTVRSDNPSKPAIRSTDCHLEFDLQTDIATFSPEVEGFASTEFPFLKYKTSIEKGVWHMNDRKVIMNTEGNDISKSYFYSTHPHQDSLAFNAKAGIYDMNTQTLNIEGVPFIKVMDGKVFPDSNKVVIWENARMETLKNATAEFDTLNTYHKLYDGTFDVKGRFKLKGTATYSYTNSSGDHYSFIFKNYTFRDKSEFTRDTKKRKKGEEKEEDIQALLVANKETEADENNEQTEEQQDNSVNNEVSSEDNKEEETDGRTVALGLIYPEDSIEVAKKILYKGKVTMFSDIKELFFDGFVKLDLKGALSYSQWLEYKNDGDTSDVKIILEDPKADNGNPLTTGLHINKSTDLYTTFISEKDALEDFDLFTTKGILKFSSHPDSSIFRVAKEEKFKNPSTVPGNIFMYDDNNSVIEYSGTFNYIKECKGLEILASGTGSAELDSSFYDFNNLMVFKFDMHKTIPEAIAANLKVVADIIPPDSSEMIQDFNLLEQIKEKQERKILELAGEKDFRNYKSESSMAHIPLYEASKVFQEGIILSNVDLKWSNQHKAFYSVGKIKVSNIGEQEIDRVMQGYVEIRKTLTGDVVNLLLEPTPNNWYFFTYDNNRVAVTSSNDEVNAVIAKKSKGEQEDREKLFFVQADLTEKANFLKMFNEKYLGKEEGYISERAPKISEQPVEELNIEEEPEPEYIEEPVEQETDEPVKRKQGKVIEEPELNRGPKEHSIEEKKQLQRDQQKMKDLFK